MANASRKTIAPNILNAADAPISPSVAIYLRGAINLFSNAKMTMRFVLNKKQTKEKLKNTQYIKCEGQDNTLFFLCSKKVMSHFEIILIKP